MLDWVLSSVPVYHQGLRGKPMVPAVGGTGIMVGGVLVGDDDGMALGLSDGMGTSSVGMTLGSTVGTTDRWHDTWC